MKKKSAFTLAEVLIALGLVGFISMILLANIGQIVPDKNVVMLKKTYNTLEQVTDALVNNDSLYGGNTEVCDNNDPNNPCFEPGDLTYLKAGESVIPKFCNGVEDMLDTVENNCGTGEPSITTIDGVEWSFSNSSRGGLIDVTVDVNGDKTNGDYVITIDRYGRMTPDENARRILGDMYNIKLKESEVRINDNNNKQ